MHSSMVDVAPEEVKAKICTDTRIKQKMDLSEALTGRKGGKGTASLRCDAGDKEIGADVLGRHFSTAHLSHIADSLWDRHTSIALFNASSRHNDCGRWSHQTCCVAHKSKMPFLFHGWNW